MTSPARAHRIAVLAGAAILAAGSIGRAADRPQEGKEATEYELLRAKFGVHRAQLKQIESTEDKIAKKREMLPEYDDYIYGVLSAAEDSGLALQDEIFANLMVWQLDVGNFSSAFTMAEHILEHNIDLPTRFKSSPATFLIDTVSTAAIKAYTLSDEFPVEHLQRASALTFTHDVFDQARANLHKAIGLLLMREADRLMDNKEASVSAPSAARREALKHLRRAYELNTNCGVKKEIGVLTRLLKKEPVEPETNGETDAPADTSDT
ncbi:phage terminase small subunit [Asticcacaulis machinosus]|uniref:Phage terminase small subunit n=1 Tax=Asticcacaulis machinosus TaxID=2984211 RepID=A0ABT5HIE2_9CAUL|nr:phage terminase small subunit [Asticcacaulis machinosus]MDC7675369.1 phage terminase small subunit [Asticcacaulis machinosus]